MASRRRPRQPDRPASSESVPPGTPGDSRAPAAGALHASKRWQTTVRWILDRPRWVAGITLPVSVLIAISGYLFADWYVCRPPGIQPTFVGRNRCAACHQQEVAAFTGSHHDRAMDHARSDTVLGDFDNATLEHDGQTTRFYRKGEGFFVETEGPDGKPAEFEVKYVFGFEPLQQYIVELDRPADLPPDQISKAQVLRASWDTQNRRWFYLRPPDVAERLEPNDPLHWTGITQNWNTFCADCHSTGLEKNFQLDSLQYATTFAEIDVSCEACHGPGSLHVELAEQGGLFWDRRYDRGIVRFKQHDNVFEVETCARCHSRRSMINDQAQPGEPFADGFACELVSPGIYHPDGQILDEVFEYGSFIQSKMYHRGIRCTDCHDPHTAKVRYPGNNLCTSCHQHPAGVYDNPAHHQHKVGSSGSLCVECHMPESHYMELDGRRDHSIRKPRPDLSVELGTPNACTQCHLKDSQLPPEKIASLGRYQDWLRAAREGDALAAAELRRLDRWAADRLEQWFPARKLDPSIAPTLAAAWNSEPEAQEQLPKIVESPFGTTPMLRASAIRASEMIPNQKMREAILEALSDADPIVLAAALDRARSLLEQDIAEIDSPGGVDRLESDAARVIERLSHPIRSVRIAAASTLAGLGPWRSRLLKGEQRDQFETALEEQFAALRVYEDRGQSQLAMGILHEDLGDSESAIEAYRQAIRIEPNLDGPRGQLAALLDRQVRSIEMALQQGNVDPRETERLAAMRTQWLDEVQQLRSEELKLIETNVRRAPQLAPLHYRYGMALYLAGRMNEASAALDQALELAPNDLGVLFAVASMREAQGRWEEVLPLAERLVAADSSRPEYQTLLQEARRRIGAASSEKLP